MPRRIETVRGLLARQGFADPDTAVGLLEELGPDAVDLVALLGRTADPDLALAGLAALAASDDVIVPELLSDEGTAMRLLLVLGASPALSEHLVRHPEHWRELTDPQLGSMRPTAYGVRCDLLRAVGADPDADVPQGRADARDALRVEYRRLLLRLAARDLAHEIAFSDVAAELSDLAAAALEGALAIARAAIADSETCRLAVIAMGKCGGRELNYVSDVDVIFVAEPVDGADEAAALGVASRLAGELMRICGDHTAEGTLWPVDPNLRPEGRSGPLVRTVASHRAYYERWASTWEFQALLKARPAAGDVELGARYCEAVAPFVWNAANREGFVDDVQAMRRRVVATLPAADADRQLKLGAGGLRDVEFAVQLLQLVHGRTDEGLRSPTTLSALSALTDGGYVGREDGETMRTAYTFLRQLEHRIQLRNLRRTHVVPSDAVELRHLARSLGFRRDPATQLDRAWRHHRREAMRLHQKLFYRPLLSAVARMSDEDARLTPEAAKVRLQALGYADPNAALRHLEALTAGFGRTAAIQRALLPAMLGWFADAPDPDAGLFGFRRISDALGTTHWYLRLLRDEGQAAERLARVLATSRYATDLLEREPDAVALLGQNPLAPKPLLGVAAEMASAAARRADTEQAALAVRAIRRRELLRIALADLCAPFGVAEVGYALADLTTATLEAVLAIAQRKVEAERGVVMPTAMAVIAMGRYGGQELSYASDADVMFVHDPKEGADQALATDMARAVALEMRRLLAMPATDPALEIDADLRPEGRHGPLVRTIESYARYYGGWSAVWEAQALLRAAPVAGDPDLSARFVALIDPLRYPKAGLSDADVVEVRRIKARVAAERLPRGADPAMHFKFGRGGVADVEWTVQLLQLRHAADVPGLRTTRTLEALTAAVDAGLLDESDREALSAAWLFASRARNAGVLVRGRPAEQFPREARDRAAVAFVLGYDEGESSQMVNDYLRTTRLAAGVIDRVFWDLKVDE